MKKYAIKSTRFFFRKEMVLLIFTGICCFVLLETATWLLYPSLFGKPFDRAAIIGYPQEKHADNLKKKAKKKRKPKANNYTIFPHPYLGYVSSKGNTDANEFGFLGPEPLAKKSPDTLVVGITGGSVAADFAKAVIFDAGKSLRSHFADKGVKFISLAMAGYKQPQQLIALSYILSLGGEFDAIINLDGFNELMLPYADNVPAKVFPAYPQRWKIQVQQTFNPESVILITQINELKYKRMFWKTVVGQTILWHSIFAVATWEAYDRRLESQFFTLNANLKKLTHKSNVPAEFLGPFKPFESDKAIYEYSGDIWLNSAIQMARLCEANDIAYFHFLQPNQYVEGSKVLTAAERKIAYSEKNTPAKRAVIHGYPLLLKRSKILLKEGIIFTDLTQIYKNVPEPIYIDKCCHVNAIGNQIMVREIGRVVKAYYNKR